MDIELDVADDGGASKVGVTKTSATGDVKHNLHVMLQRQSRFLDNCRKVTVSRHDVIQSPHLESMINCWQCASSSSCAGGW